MYLIEFFIMSVYSHQKELLYFSNSLVGNISKCLLIKNEFMIMNQRKEGRKEEKKRKKGRKRGWKRKKEERKDGREGRKEEMEGGKEGGRKRGRRDS